MTVKAQEQETTVEVDPLVLACVTRGAAVLYKHDKRWVSKVPWAKVDFVDERADVLAFLFGDLRLGLRVLGIEPEDAWEYGFDQKIGTAVTLPALIKLWRRQTVTKK